MNRRWAARLAAPAAFLAGVTVAVVLVRAGFSSGDEPATTAVAVTTAPTTTAKKPKPKPAVFATVESGDTLDQIALDNNTTVERILELNPGLDPTGLQVGQKVRVR
ncbi:MAG TPA: LysM domain-containing protein [Gaiellaceae bacterium]|nr:LysM domain-containing protein [Gaiellaceae bacterium]